MLPFRGWGNWGSGSCSFCVPELALWIPISVLCLLPASAAVSRHGRMAPQHRNLWALPCSVPPSFQSKGPSEGFRSDFHWGGGERPGAPETGMATEGDWGTGAGAASDQQGHFPGEGLKVGTTCMPVLQGP